MEVIEIAASTFWKGEVGVKGVVEDQGEPYKVSLYLKGSQVYDYSCSCTVGDSFRGMCDHCKEVLAVYKKQEGEGHLRPVMTSQEVRTMIREYTNREVAQIIVEGGEEKVKFLPKLFISSRGVKAEFRVGRERFCVVKDLLAFADAVEMGTYVEYGKTLGFHHNVGVFTEESRPLVSLVTELVNSYKEHYEQFQRGTFRTIPSLRELNLGKGDRDRFFEMIMNQYIDLQDEQGKIRKVTVLKENPELEVMVEKIGKDGIRVLIDKNIFCFSGEHYLYISNSENIYRCEESCSNTLRVFLEEMVQIRGSKHEIEVNERDIPLFYERVLQKIEPYGIVKAKGIDLESYKPEVLKVRFDFDSSNPRELTMCPTLSYGSFHFHPIEDEKLPRTVCRDIPSEFRISQLITKYFKYKQNDTENLVIRDDEDGMYQLLSQGMEEFMSLGEVFLSESFEKLRILPPPKVSVGISMSGNWLDLDVDVQGISGTELIRLLNEYNQKKKYYRLKNGEFLRLEDNGLMTVAKLMEGLAISKSELQTQKIHIPKYRALYLDSVLKEGQDITLYRDNLFKSVVRGMKSVEDSDYEIPTSLHPILRGYQKTGFRWLRTLDFYGFGGILADDMGLGKTIQVISLLLDEAVQKNQRASLIVCPASLVYNWENEILLFAPALRVLTVVGSSSEREERLKDIKDYDVVITSYDLLKRDIAFYIGREFRFQIIDEAQYIKNAGTQSAKAVKMISAQTKFALTGTPIENRLSELWSIFDYLMPGFLFGYQKFKKDYEIPIVKEQDGKALKHLHQMIGPFILRRLKQDVLQELPDKLESVVYSKFEKVQKDLYMAHAKQLKDQLQQTMGSESNTDKLQILSQLTRLRQICCDPSLCYSNYHGESAKLETCIDLVVNGVEGGHKILLFSQFTSMLEIIGKRLQKENLLYYSLTGSTPKEERMRLVNAFHRDQVQVFLISLKAGGTGLNLTAADVVIHYDPWWNVAVQNQATDRAHRIGQEKQVSVFRLITKHTIEENIMLLQESKKNLAEQIITEGTISLGSLTKEDLIGLLD